MSERAREEETSSVACRERPLRGAGVRAVVPGREPHRSGGEFAAGGWTHGPAAGWIGGALGPGRDHLAATSQTPQPLRVRAEPVASCREVRAAEEASL